MAALALGPEIFGKGFRLLPTPEEAVTYYLPRLVAGKPLHAAVRPVVHHADVYASAPADLARRFRPLPKTGDRFFFTPKRAPAGAAQASSRDGSWQAQTTVAIKDRGDAKVGELRKLRYKKSGGGGYTDWLMDEYSCCGPVAGDGETQFVLCKMYVSPRAAQTSDAHKESAAYFFTRLPPPPPAAVVIQPALAPAPAAAPKRPAAPLQHAVSPPCAKRMRGPAVLTAPPAQPPAPPAPTRPPLAAVRMTSFAPPHPSAPAPRRSSTAPSATQPSPASAPPAPIRTPLAAVRMMSFAPPPQPCAPRRGSTTPLATQPSHALAPPLAPPVPIRPAMQMQPHRSLTTLPAPPQPLPQKVRLLPTPPVQSKQRRILDPFEAAMLRDEAEEQAVAAAPRPPPPPAPAAAPALQDGDEDNWDDLDKALEFEE